MIANGTKTWTWRSATTTLLTLAVLLTHAADTTRPWTFWYWMYGAVTEAGIKADAYFASDETHVVFVDDVNALRDMGHGVLMERKGVSGTTQNQRFSYTMTINNPSLTGQVLIACARATRRLMPAAYTLVEVPVIDLLEGERDQLIRQLV